MKFNRALAAGVAALLVILAGCAAPQPRARDWAKLGATTNNLVAYQSEASVEISLPLPGRDTFAHATWPAFEIGTTNYQHRFATLTFEEEDRAARKEVRVRRNRLAIRDAGQWQRLVQQIFSGLVPAQAGHGVLLLVHNQETVVFRDRAGRFGVVQLVSKPPEIILDHTYNDTDFSRAAIERLKSGVNTLDPNQNRFLFVTGQDPAFVLIDIRQRFMVFLGFPADPEAPGMPGWFAARALRSLFVRSLLITAVKNPVTLVSRGFWHLGSSGAAAIQSGGPDTSDAPPPPLATGPGMDLAAWEQDLDRLVAAPRYKGKLDLFIDGEKFFPEFIQAVQAATNSVDLSVYIFDNDDYAVKIADLLKKRSTEVRVRVLEDDLGSLFAGEVTPESPMPADFKSPGDMESYLRDGSRVKVRTTSNPWLTVDHRKFFIIDGRRAYLGGMNIGREYRYDWHDMMVGLTGPIVGRLQKSYDLAWAHAGPLGDFAYAWIKLFESAPPRKASLADGMDIRALRTATGRTEIYRAQLEAIARARQYIYLENAYFEDDTIMRALVNARRRGVDVRVVFPAKNDSDIMQIGGLVVANELIKNGIRVYAYPGMTHVKAAIYDDWACLGSANFNKMSLRIGQELDIAFSDPAAVNRLKRELFETDFARSRELTTQVPLNWFDFLVKTFANQL